MCSWGENRSRDPPLGAHEAVARPSRNQNAGRFRMRAPGGESRDLLRDVLPELAAARRVAELAQRVRLDLPDPLAGQAELVADLLERPRPAVVEAEAEPEDALLAAVEAVERPARPAP